MDDEERVAQPAIAIIPVARGARCLGDRGGVRGDNGARLLEAAQLERDGRSDHSRLPFEWNAQMPGPGQPVLARAIEKITARRIDCTSERLVGPHRKRDRPRQREGRFRHDVGEGGVRRQAHDVVPAHIADVVRADRILGYGATVVVGWTHADRNIGKAGDRLDAPNDLRWPEDAPVMREAWCEIRDAHLAASSIGHDRLDQCGVANIGCLRVHAVGQNDVAEAFFLVPGQKTRKDWIGIKSRKAPPHEVGLGCRSVRRCGNCRSGRGRGALVLDRDS